MIIKIKTKTDIIWPAVLLYILQCYVINSELFTLLCVACIGIYILATRKILIPKIPGFVLYLATIVLITLIGITRFPTNLVVKDLFYEISSLIPIIVGYYLYSLYGKTKSIWKTTCFMVMITSIVCIIQSVGVIGGGVDFTTLREIFGVQVTPLAIIFPILVGKRFVFGEISFSKIKDVIIILILTIQLILSVSRTAIVIAIVGFVIMFVIGNFDKATSTSSMGRTVALIIFMSIIGIVAWNTMPESVTGELSNKFSKTFTEIDSDTEFSNTGDAQDDWRGYEIHCAQEQWKENNLVKQIFGEGNGSVILISYVPGQFQEIVISQSGGVGISILHNTYYTLLVKGGVLTLALFIYFFLVNIIKGIKCLKNTDRNIFFGGIILIVICVGVLVGAYVVRSMFEKRAMLCCMLLIGWINAEINDRRYDVVNEMERGDSYAS